MKIELDYGKNGVFIEVPGDSTSVITPSFVTGLSKPKETLLESLQNPIGTAPLGEQVTPGSKIGIVFNDITRATPNGVILPVIIDVLHGAGIRDEDIVLFNATGTHRTNADKELRAILTDELVDTYRIVQNDSQDADSFIRVDSTDVDASDVDAIGQDQAIQQKETNRHKQPVFLNREFFECDFHILTGFIEPHFFAGFSGGPKAIMPGMASLDTIIHNHSAAHLDNASSTWGITNGNPLWEELRRIAGTVPSTFIVNVTLNRDKEITNVFAGDMDEAHAAGCAFSKQSAMVEVDDYFDIVVTTNSGYPLDLNLYQSVKGVSAAAQVVREGGSIIIAAECWDGIPEHGAFGRILKEAQSFDALLEKLRSPDFKMIDMWQAHILATISQKAEVYVYSDGLTEEQIDESMLIPCPHIGETVASLVEHYGPEARVCVLPEGPLTIPYVTK